MIDDISVGPASALDRFLRRARWRLTGRRFVEVWILLLAMTIGAAVLVLVLGRLGIVPWPMRGAWFTSVMLATGGSMAVAAAVVLSSRPDLRRVARIVDRRLGLKSLLTTSLEVHVKNGALSLAEMALLSELDERIATLDSASAAGQTWRRWHGAVVLAAVLSAAAGALPPPAQASMTETPAATAALAEVAWNLNRIADALESEGEVASGPLASVTSSFRELANRAERGELTDEELGAQVSTLLGSLAVTTELLDPGLSQLVSDALSDIARRPEPTTAGDEADPFRFGSDPTAPEPVGTTDASSEPEASSANGFDPSEVFRTLGEVASSLEDREAGAGSTKADREDSSGTSDVSSAPASIHYTEWEEVMGDEFMARQAALRQRGAGEVAVGEARDSDDSAGEAAGDGTQPIPEGVAAQRVDLSQMDSESLALSAEQRENGRLVTQMPEPLEGVAGVAWDPIALAESLVPAAERPLRLEHIGVSDAALVAKYFSRQGAAPGSVSGE